MRSQNSQANYSSQYRGARLQSMACSRYEQHNLQFKTGFGNPRLMCKYQFKACILKLWITVQAVDYILLFKCCRNYTLPLIMGSQRNLFSLNCKATRQASYDTKLTTSYSSLEDFCVFEKVDFVVTLIMDKFGGPKCKWAFQRIRTHFASRLERAVCHHVVCCWDRNLRSTIMTRKTMWLSTFPLKWCFKLRYAPWTALLSW